MADKNELTVADNVMTPFLGCRFAEIRDAVINDIVLRAHLETQVEEFETAMTHLGPYLRDDPTRTVAQALELLRRDLAANQAAAAVATDKE